VQNQASVAPATPAHITHRRNRTALAITFGLVLTAAWIFLLGYGLLVL